MASLWQAVMDMSVDEAMRYAPIGLIIAFFTILMHVISRNAGMFTKKCTTPSIDGVLHDGVATGLRAGLQWGLYEQLERLCVGGI